MNGGFEQPEWFFLLFAVPAVAVFYALALRARRAALQKFLGDAAPERLAAKAGRNRRAVEAGLAALVVGLATLALAGPRWGRDIRNVKRAGADIVVVLDASRSMLAEDSLPHRLERARREVRGLLDAAAGARIALVTFAGDARIVCPLTRDHDTLGLFLDEIDPTSDHRGGSTLALALRTAGDALEASSGAGRAVVLISDGEDPSDPSGSGAASAARRLAARGIQVHAIGVGSAQGARIPVRDDSTGTLSFFKDKDGVEVVTHLAPESLQAIARSGNGEYLAAGAVAFPMDELWRGRLSRLGKGEAVEEGIDELRARFQWFLAAAILGLCGWWVAPFAGARVWQVRGARPRLAWKTATASSAQRVILIAMLAFAADANADAVDEGAKGDVLYRKGDFGGAAAAYEHASKGIETEHGAFNLGNARFMQKSWRQAAKSWSDAERRAVDPTTRRDASYNRGLALLRAADEEDQGRTETLKSSIEAFNAALRLDPTDDGARHNRAIAIARWVQSQQDPDAKGKGGGEKGDTKSPDKQKGDPKSDGEGEDGKGEPGGEGDGDQDGTGKGEDGDPKEKESEPGQDGDPVDAAEVERMERLLDAREAEQHRLQQVKNRMHRKSGENDW